MFKLALAGLWRHKARVFFLSLSIIVGVAFSAAALIWQSTSLASVENFYEAIDASARGDLIVEEDRYSSAGVYKGSSEEFGEKPVEKEPAEGVSVEVSASESGGDNSNQPSETILTDGLIKEIKALNYSFEEVSGFIEETDWQYPSLYTPDDRAMATREDGLGFVTIYSHQKGSQVAAYAVVEGQAPQSLGEIAIDEEMAEKYKLKVGDVLTHKNLVAKEEGSRRDQLQKTKYKLVGLVKGKSVSLADSLLFLDSSFVVFAPQAARNFVELQPTDGWSKIRIKLAEGSSLASKKRLAAEIERLKENSLQVTIPEEEASERQEEEIALVKTATDQISYTVLFFVALAMVVAVFVIINTFNVLLAQRGKEIALLRALSFSRSQVVGLVVLESLLIGVFSAVVGALVGIGIAQIALNFTANFLIESSTTLVVVRAGSFIYPSVLALFVAVVAGLLPAIKASRMSPIAVLTESSQLKPQSVKWRSIIGGILLSFGLLIIFPIVLIVLKNPASNTDSLNAVYTTVVLLLVLGGGILVFVGLALFSAVLIRWFARLFAFLHRRRQISAQLAAGNILRAPKQAAFAANALIIGVSLISFVTILLGSFQHSFTYLIERWQPAEWTVESKSDSFRVRSEEELAPEVSPQIVVAINSDDHFRHVTAVRSSVALQLRGQHSDNEDINTVLILDKADHLKEVISPSLKPEVAEALNRGQAALISDQPIDSSKIQIDYGLGEERQAVEYDIGALAVGSEMATGSFWGTTVLLLEEHFPDDSPVIYSSVLFDTQRGVDPSEAEVALQAILSDSPNLRYRGVSSIVEYIDNLFETLLNIFRTLLSLSLVVAIIGVFNVLSLAIIERTKEMGILRALGMSKLQLGKMIVLESALIIFFGSLVGMLVGLFFAWIAWLILTSPAIMGDEANEVLELVFSIPWLQMLLYFVVAAVLALIAAFWPALRAMRLRIIESIKKS